MEILLNSLFAANVFIETFLLPFTALARLSSRWALALLIFSTHNLTWMKWFCFPFTELQKPVACRRHLVQSHSQNKPYYSRLLNAVFVGVWIFWVSEDGEFTTSLDPFSTVWSCWWQNLFPLYLIALSHIAACVKSLIEHWAPWGESPSIIFPLGSSTYPFDSCQQH